MMRSAMAFFPDSMITFMNLERSTEPNFGSGRMSRLGTSRRRGISLPFASVGSGSHPHLGRHRHLGRPTYSTSPIARRNCRATITSTSGLSGLLRTLGAVLRTRLLAVFHALQVERTADDVITHARQILDATTTHEHDTVLLQVVAF